MSTPDILLIIGGAILMIVGLLGSVLPVLPGLPLSYIGILLLHFTSIVQFSPAFLIVWLLIVIAMQVFDYFIPIWGTKFFGGSKYGTWGSTIGIIVGLFFSPWGIILGPFVGAVIGELLYGKQFALALKAGLGAFIGFLTGTFAKIVIGLVLIFFFVRAIILAV